MLMKMLIQAYFKENTMNDSWTIKAYQHKNGTRELVEWATGFGHRQARDYYQRLYDSNDFSELRMTRVTPEVILYKKD